MPLMVFILTKIYIFNKKRCFGYRGSGKSTLKLMFLSSLNLISWEYPEVSVRLLESKTNI